jgi:hypothetical protein
LKDFAMLELIATNDSRATRNKNNVLALYDLMINQKRSEEHVRWKLMCREARTPSCSVSR